MSAIYSNAAKTAKGCGCAPECPACGGLTCLCRPRFFAGQVLSDDDLNALENYVVNKNKLHNRYLHGWGVVCGLKVGCSDCRDRVSIQPGYALGPCGDDIVVCGEASVSVCDLIRRCRPPARADRDCPPMAFDPADCQDGVEDWILAICYDEQTARGIMPLRGGDGGCGCGGKCGCGEHGGASKGGCGCGAAHGSTVRQSRSNGMRRNASPACEPTQTCEGFSFTVYKPPVPKRGEKPSNGAWADAVAACTQELASYFTGHPDPTLVTGEQLRQWICDTRQGLADRLNAHPPQDCRLLDVLQGIAAPPAGTLSGTAYANLPAYDTAVAGLTEVVTEFVRQCLCDAMMPACPPPVDCNCVPLATVTVRRSDCRILKVCNVGPRQFALTFPDLVYWLGGTGILKNLHDQVEAFCCPPPKKINFKLKYAVAGVQPVFAMNAAAGPKASAFAKAMSASWTGTKPKVDAEALAMAALGVSPDGKPAATAFDLENPLATLGIDALLKPTLAATLPAEWLKAAPAPAPDATHALQARLDELAAALERQTELTQSLSGKVDEQAKEITKLKRR